jgi:SAM-dependent methyltransferase
MSTPLSARERVEHVLANPDPALLEKIRSRTFTGHNIPLSATESTLGLDIPLIGDDPRTRTIKALIRRYLHGRDDLRVVDLGALDGGVSFELAREGWQTTGVEGRQSNFENAELIRAYFGLENLRFLHRDVKTLDAAEDGLFDAIVCCGLLYHLDDPFTFVRQMAGMLAPGGLLFLDTCVEPDEQASKFDTWKGKLSEHTTYEHGGHLYDGCWADEPREGTPLDRQWSAVSNSRSFWPSRRSLIRAVHHSGLHAVSELFGAFEIDREIVLRDQFSRLWLLCRREW